MATQTGSIDLEATNAVKLAAEASVDNKLTNYATHAQLELSANNIKSEVAETYATKDEAQPTNTGSGTVVTSDDAANLPPLSLTIHGKSVQDGTPTPSAPVPIKSVGVENILDLSNFPKATTTYLGCTLTNNGDGTFTLSGTNTGSNAWGFNSTTGTQTLPEGTYTLSAGGTLEGCYLRVLIGGTSYQVMNDNVTVFTLDSPKNITQWIVTVYGGATISGTIRPTIVSGEQIPLAGIPFGEVDAVCYTRSRNLIPRYQSSNRYQWTVNGISVNSLDDGTVVLNGTATAAAWITNVFSEDYPAGTYTVSGNNEVANSNVRLCPNYDGSTQQLIMDTVDATMTFTASTKVSACYILVPSGASVSNFVIKPQMERGNTATAYQPYSLDATNIDLQGNALCSTPDNAESVIEIDGEGNATLVKRVTSQTFDGSESWHSYNYGGVLGYYRNVDYAPLYHYNNALGKAYCSAFEYKNAAVANTWHFSSNREVNFKYPTATTVDEWKAYLAENPLTIVYELAEPQTISLGKIDLPSLPSPSFSMHVDASVAPTLDAEWWTMNGYETGSVTYRASTLEQDVNGLTVQMQGKVDSDEEWVSWMHAGTDPTTHEPYLAMGQDSDYPSVVYGSGEAQFYDGEGDVEHNILARFGSNGAIIGRSDESHITQTATTTRLFGSDGILVLEAGFQNVSNGHGSTKQGVRVTDSNNASYIAVNPTTDSSGFDGKLDFDVYCKGIGLMSSSGGEVVISSDFVANGLHAAVEARKTISGTEQIHGFTLGFDPNDNPYVNIGNPAAWLAALGLTVQEGAMTFASGLNSSYGSAPVRKYGAMGILKLNSVRLAAQLASGGSVVIGTLPTGFLPLGSVDMHINIESNSSNYRNNYITVEYSESTNPGMVTLYNRSGAAIPNTVTFSCTCPFFIG